MYTSHSEYRGSTTHKVFAAILRSIDTAYSRKILDAASSGDWDTVTSASVSPDDYSCHKEFGKDYLVSNLLRKCADLPIRVNRSALALSAFFESEGNCKGINHYGGRNPFVSDDSPLENSFEATIWLAKEKIAKLLGKFDWNDAAEHFGFSGGACTRLPRKAGAPFYKYQGKPEVTRNAALLAVCAIWERPLWRAQMQDTYGLDPCNWVTIVEASRLTTVPKTALIDRSICIEPEMNMFLQLGIGKLIRRKLKSKARIDLHDQSLNQHFARIGSSTGSLSTIDLKSASDSISLSLVEALLPYDWFDAVKRTRSEYVMPPSGVKHRLEKVSSMGNGYTFELETLIFWALSSAVIELSGVTDKRLAVYGDDIIVHHECAPRLIAVLDYCGFETNKSKTFVSGPFRESCGKHYFYGQDVTPFYIKSGIDNLVQLYWSVNSFRFWPIVYDCATGLKTYRYLVSLIPRQQRIKVPASFGLKAGIICNFDEATPRYCIRRQAFVCDVVAPVRRRHRPNGYAAVLQWFGSVGSKPSDSLLVLEKGDVMYRRKRVYISWWDCVTSHVSVT